MKPRHYDSSVGPVDPSAVIKGFDLSSARPGIPWNAGRGGRAKRGGGGVEQGWSRAPSSSPADPLFISSAPL